MHNHFKWKRPGRDFHLLFRKFPFVRRRQRENRLRRFSLQCATSPSHRSSLRRSRERVLDRSSHRLWRDRALVGIRLFRILISALRFRYIDLLKLEDTTALSKYTLLAALDTLQLLLLLLLATIVTFNKPEASSATTQLHLICSSTP